MSGCGQSLESLLPTLSTAPNVDIQRYMGTWYEIAKYPVTFENGCFGVTADYTLQSDGNVKVVNICRNEDGTVGRTIEGFATVADSTTNSKLTVYFFYPFGAPYWIIELDEADYEWAVVGDPTRTFLWILSRTPTLAPEIYDGILQRLPDRGYDPVRLELMPQFPEETP
ncbi:MAG: lipocalin family protein [Planctomycetes bacterium]|nr:lipocalin family protein [Planctomycetota bacterium]